MNVVYTALFGDASRDTVLPPTYVDPDARYLVFSDLSQKHFPDPYVVMRSMAPLDAWSSRKKARWHKINSCLLFKSLYGEIGRVEPIQTIWHDASFQLVDLPENIHQIRGEAHIAVARHRMRNCLYAEARECAKLNLDEPLTLYAQTERYQNKDFPPQAGLYETGLLLRNSTQWRTAELEGLWWHEVDKFSLRDQVSFPYVLNSSSAVALVLPTIDRLSFATYRSHNGKGKKRT